MKHILLNITALVVCGFAVSANAQEATYLIIKKELGTAPQVNAASVDLLGAQNLYKILGENYLILAPNMLVNIDGATRPTRIQWGRPGPRGQPWTQPSIILICSCPEDYITELEQRFKHFGLDTLLQPRAISPFDQGDAQ